MVNYLLLFGFKNLATVAQSFTLLINKSIPFTFFYNLASTSVYKESCIINFAVV